MPSEKKRDRFYEQDKQHVSVTADILLPGALFFFLIPFFSTSFLKAITFKQSFRETSLTISFTGGHIDQQGIEDLILRKDENSLEMGRGNVGRT